VKNPAGKAGPPKRSRCSGIAFDAHPAPRPTG
jgi:hypothetical protein